jgi:fibronectin-binding autotransporter adhesin
MRTRHFLAPAILAASVAAVLFPNFVAAVEKYWDGTDITPDADGGDGVWNLSLQNQNWDDAPTAGNPTFFANNDIAIFGGTGGIVALGEPLTANGLTFNATNYTISNGGTAANVLTLGAPAVTVTNLTDTATISAAIGGTVGLNKLGNGTLVLSGANTYAGVTAITAGVVNVRTASALGAITSGTTVSTGAALELQGGVAVGAEALSLSGSGILGGGALRNVSGTNSWAGTVVITQSTGASILSDAGLLTISGVVSGSASGTALTIGGAGDITISASTANTITSMTKVGAGTLRFTADPNQVGITTINEGVIELNHSGTIDYNTIINNSGTLRALTAAVADTTDITVNAGGTYDFRVSDTIGGLAGAGLVTKGVGAVASTLTVNNGGETTTFSGVIENGVSGTATTLAKNGSGTLTLTGANTYTGNTGVNAGTLAVNGAAGSIATSAALNIGDNNSGGDTASFGMPTDLWTSGALNRINDNATVTLNGSSIFSYTGPASGSSGKVERIGNLVISNGRNILTLSPGTDSDVQVTASTLSRANSGVVLIRGASLGSTGPGSTRLVLTTPVVAGSGGADGTTTKNIVPFAIGDTPTGAGSGFLTHDATIGLRLLAEAEYDTAIAGASAPLRNVSTGGGETVSADVRINSLRVTGGPTSINAGVELLVNSGAVLFTAAGSIDGAGSLDFGGSAGVLTVAANTTAITGTVSASIGGAAGLTISSTGDVNNTVVLGGDNTFIGGLVINPGLVRLANTGALNNESPQAVTLATGTAALAPILELGGLSVTVRNLAAATNSQGIVRNASATAATLKTIYTAATTYNGVLTNGTGSAALSYLKSGSGIVTMQANSDYTGATVIEQGGITLSANNVGRLTGTSGIMVGAAAQLRISNANNNNSTDRLNNAASLTLQGGIFEYDVGQDTTNFSEQLTNLIVGRGLNTFITDITASAQTNVFTFSGALSRQDTGALLAFQNFTVAGVQTGIGTTNSRARVVFNTAPILTNGIIVGAASAGTVAPAYAYIFTNAETAANDTLDFATYNADVDAATGSQPSITRFTGYLTEVEADWGSSDIERAAAATTLTDSRDVFALKLQDTATLTTAVNLDLGAHTLNVHSGGIIQSSQAETTISNGTLTAGGNAAGELILMVDDTTATVRTLKVNSVIANNSGGGAVSLVKAGADNLVLLSANTYTGKTVHNGGTISIDTDGNLGTAPAASTPAHLVLNGATLALTNAANTIFVLNANRGIELGGSGNVTGVSGTVGTATNVISILAGTAGNGRILQYNGPGIQSAPNSVASLTFLSNAATGSTDPGGVIGTLTSDSNITGDLVIESTTSTGSTVGSFNFGGTSNVIGRSLRLGGNGSATVTYGVAGGSLAIGSGTTDFLDIGVNGGEVFNTVGTLNLAGTATFTANVDQVRIGRASTGFTGQGVLMLSTNSNITAATSFIIGDTVNAGNGVANSVTFGAGTSSVTTQTFTVGGNKSRGDVTIGAGGILNLHGAGANTLNLNIGVYGGTGTAGLTSTLSTAGGTLVAELNSLVIAQKTGGTNGGVLGTFTVNGSANDIVANSVSIGNVTGNTTAGSNATTGTLNFGGGAFLIHNDVALATFSTNTGSTPTSSGTLNITGGTFTVSGNITRSTSDEVRSNSYVNVNGGTLDLQNQATGDTTAGTLTASQLAFRSGSIVDVASATLQATNSSSGGGAGTAGDALIVRDVTLSIPTIFITGAVTGNIHYEAAGGGSGGVVSGTLNLGSIVRSINVENSAAALFDLELSGSISGASGGINKTGSGTLVLSGSNDYTGGTVVTTGALIAAVNKTLGAGNVTILNTAVSLTLATGVADAIADGASVSISGGGAAGVADAGFMNLSSDVNDTIVSLILGGAVQNNPGTYGSTFSSADYRNDEFFSGPGVLTLVPEPGSAISLLGGFGMLAGLQRFRRRQD